MISTKQFLNVNGTDKRFLSEFIIASDQHCKVYVHNLEQPTLTDLIGLDKYDLVDNSIIFYTAPAQGSIVTLEVATNMEDFGVSVSLPAMDRAENAANAAETYALQSKAYRDQSQGFSIASQTYSNNAQTYSTNAASYASLANNKSLIATDAATNALAYATAAQNSYLATKALETSFNSTASGAIAIANAANTKSNTAIASANTAIATADYVSSQLAYTTGLANDAITAAANAESTANAASYDAALALYAANTASTAATAAQTDATTALTNAATADGKATTALTNAATADGKATTALTNAATALTTASGALADALTANIAADVAQSTADLADAKADGAVTTANAAYYAATHITVPTTITHMNEIDFGASNYSAIQSFGNDLRFLASSGGGDILFQYGKFIPTYDNNMNLGTAGNRWAIIYAAVGTIQTSDERSKQQIRTISDAERAVAIKLKNSLRAFKFNDSVASKTPETARWHFGTIAQNVQEAFTSEGLDGFAYGVLCYDTWGDTPEVLKEDGSVDIPAIPAGNRYGIRYDELLCFIIAAM